MEPPTQILLTVPLDQMPPINGATGSLNCRIQDLQTMRAVPSPGLCRGKPHSKPTALDFKASYEGKIRRSHTLSQEHSPLSGLPRPTVWVPLEESDSHPGMNAWESPAKSRRPRLLPPGSWEVTKTTHSLCSLKDSWKRGCPLGENNRKVWV